MKIREKNPVMKNLLENLVKLDKPLYRGIAKGLNKPVRRKHSVNLYHIEKNVKAKETIVVPGSVLGTGNITKPVTVAALKFSGKAQELIEKAGGKCLSIQDLIESKPKNVRIIG